MKKYQRQRAQRGSVKVNQRDERLQLRWTVASKRFSLSVGINTPLNMHSARKLAAQIEQDILLERFDPTLEKYKPKPIELEPIALSTVELFEQFIEHRRQSGTSGQAISTRYNAMAANLKRFGKDIANETEARKFVELLRSRQSSLIANQNLAMLKSFGGWAVEQNLLTINPFSSIKPLKGSKTSNPKRKPFTRNEIGRLLETAKTHPKFYKWHDFCMTLLYLGLRPSEAIGLRWQDIDLHRATITIAESLARDEDGRTSGTARVRKGTKTGNIRILPIPGSLLAMLQGRFKSAQPHPNDLIFLSPKGKPIDDHSFSQRVWKPICIAASIPYRVPYASRHTVLSHVLEDGMSIHQAQYIAGHASPRMVVETYGHMINLPKLIDWQSPT